MTDGKPSQVQYVAVDDLHFDPDNPRLPISLRAAPENEVFAFLLRECNLVELMLSIGSQGFFPGEPLLCCPREGGGYIVVEGNRRLAAVKLLLREDAAPVQVKQVAAAREMSANRPSSLPVIVFAARTEIITYLGYRHITGVNQWGALEKARYLAQLSAKYEGNPEKFKILARDIGSRSDYVAQTLTALALIDRANDIGFFSKYGVNAEALPFSLLTTAISYSSIAGFIGLESKSDSEAEAVDEERLEEFFKWLFVEEAGRTRVGESRNLKMLARVVSNDQALEKFREGNGLLEADLYTEGPLILLRKTLIEISHRFSVAQEALKHAQGISEVEQEQAKSIERAAKSLHASISVNIGE